VRNLLSCLAFELQNGGISMADDRLNRGQPDRSFINMNEDYEVKYWTKHLGVSREELRPQLRRSGIPLRLFASNLAKQPDRGERIVTTTS
jgi:hypothetical protein